MSEAKLPEVVQGIYKHYKGNFYKVLFTATHSETLELLVVYQPMYGEKAYWVRPLSMFIETVTFEGKTVARFELQITTSHETGTSHFSGI